MVVLALEEEEEAPAADGFVRRGALLDIVERVWSEELFLRRRGIVYVEEVEVESRYHGGGTGTPQCWCWTFYFGEARGELDRESRSRSQSEN